MCGIIGYTGTERVASDILLTGLSGLEYRGYDSAGLSVSGESLMVYKRRGEGVGPRGRRSGRGTRRHGRNRAYSAGVRMGHQLTRTLIHIRTVPKSVAVVHNGIIENDQSLRDELEAGGAHV